jgi:hypothetical protein
VADEEHLAHPVEGGDEGVLEVDSADARGGQPRPPPCMATSARLG